MSASLWDIVMTSSGCEIELFSLYSQLHQPDKRLYCAGEQVHSFRKHLIQLQLYTAVSYYVAICHKYIETPDFPFYECSGSVMLFPLNCSELCLRYDKNYELGIVATENEKVI